MKRLVCVVLLLVAGQLSATNWYVSNTAKGSANGTSWANAWAINSIGWGSVQAGDTVYLDGGSTSLSYSYPLTVGNGGTSGSPITISIGQDSGHNGTAVFDAGGGTSAAISFGGYQYVTLTGNYSGARHILVQNGNLGADYALITGGGSGCSTYPCSASNFQQGIKVLYVEVSGAGDGMNFVYPYGIEIAYNYVHNIGCDHGVGVNGSADFMSGALWGLGAKIHDNIIQVNNSSTSSPNTGTGPDAITGTSGMDVYNNVIYGAQGTNTCGQHQDGVQWAGNYERVYGNKFYCLANSVSEGDQYDKTNHTAADGHYWLYNNVIGQCAGQSNSHGWETVVHTSASGSNLATTAVTDYQFWSNTVTDMTGFSFVRLLFGGTSVTLTNSSIKDNIVYNTGSVYDLGNAAYTCGTDFVIDHNNVNAGAHGGGSIQQCDGASYTATNIQTGAPVFTSYSEYSPASNDLHLSASSTADIGTGLNLYSSFTTDKDGAARPTSSAWDIGAYQYSSGGGTTYYALTTSQGANGTLTCSPPTGSIASGTTITCSVSAATNYSCALSGTGSALSISGASGSFAITGDSTVSSSCTPTGATTTGGKHRGRIKAAQWR